MRQACTPPKPVPIIAGERRLANRPSTHLIAIVLRDIKRGLLKSDGVIAEIRDLLDG